MILEWHENHSFRYVLIFSAHQGKAYLILYVYPHFTFKKNIFFLQIKTAFWLCLMKISHLSLSNLNMQWQPRLANWSRIPICVKCDTVVPSTQLRCKSSSHKKSNFWFLNSIFSQKLLSFTVLLWTILRLILQELVCDFSFSALFFILWKSLEMIKTVNGSC